MAAPLSVPAVASTWVGGPSHAPVQVPMTITLFKPSGVTYTKTEVPNNVQVFSSFRGQEGPHTVAQKTAPMFAYYIKTHVLLNADII